MDDTAPLVAAPPRPTAPWLRLDDGIEEVLLEYDRRQADEEALVARLSPAEVGRRRDELLVSVGRAAGIVLNVLARESRAGAILELGTAYGYSTLWLAEAARANGGRVCSVDIAASKQQQARAALARAGLHDVVDFHAGNALTFLAATRDTYDFVLLDVWKDGYIPCLEAVLGRLRTGATIVTDNMLAPPFARMAGARFVAHLRRLADLDTVVLPVGSGLAVSRYHGRRGVAG